MLLSQHQSAPRRLPGSARGVEPRLEPLISALFGSGYRTQVWGFACAWTTGRHYNLASGTTSVRGRTEGGSIMRCVFCSVLLAALLCVLSASAVAQSAQGRFSYG